MRPTRLVPATLVLALALSAAPGRAQDFFVSASGGYSDLTNAKRSAKAVFGGSGKVVLGGEVGAGLGRSFFVSLNARYTHRSGERVFVADASSPAFPLGHPLTLNLIPVYGLVGYRFSPRRSLAPYVGLGPGLTLYREQSDVAGETFTDDRTKVSFHVVAGLEFGSRRTRFGAEAQYAFVPSTIGVAGVSQVYGESDVGGFSIVGRVVFGHRRR